MECVEERDHDFCRLQARRIGVESAIENESVWGSKTDGTHLQVNTFVASLPELEGLII